MTLCTKLLLSGKIGYTRAGATTRFFGVALECQASRQSLLEKQYYALDVI